MGCVSVSRAMSRRLGPGVDSKARMPGADGKELNALGAQAKALRRLGQFMRYMLSNVHSTNVSRPSNQLKRPCLCRFFCLSYACPMSLLCVSEVVLVPFLCRLYVTNALQPSHACLPVKRIDAVLVRSSLLKTSLSPLLPRPFLDGFLSILAALRLGFYAFSMRFPCAFCELRALSGLRNPRLDQRSSTRGAW